MSGFGDSEPADALDADAPDADPEQVAIRLHEERVKLRALAGEVLPHWSQLDDDERAVGLAIVLAVVVILRREGTRL